MAPIRVSTDLWLPTVISTGCMLTPRGGGFSGHIHADHDEICLVANQPSWIRHAGHERVAEPGTVFLFRRGEFHGYRNEAHHEPHLWLVHFVADEALYRECPVLASTDPDQRVWHLSPVQQRAYQGLFVRLQAELASAHSGSRAATAAWLRLILIGAARWREPQAPSVAPPPHDAALMNLWEVIHDCVDRPADFSGALARRVPKYDALRHRFKATYGLAPRDLLLHLRMHRAKQLLLESDMTVTAIAAQLGYGRSHEFTRVFHSHVGCTPTAFRANPFQDVDRDRVS